MPEPVCIIGAGPAGRMAAEVISAAGYAVEVFDAMPTPGRKFLRAGVGGLNLTHSEPIARFRQRYGTRAAEVAPWLERFGPEAVRAWADGLGIATFVGSSGRVFPVGMKAAPLLRNWLARLREQGVRFHLRHRWLGWADDGALRFATPDAEHKVGAGDTATVFALGGGSWSRLGSDGTWMVPFAARGIATAPLRPANCGFDVPWSEHLLQRFAGQAIKTVRARIVVDSGPGENDAEGEFVITRHGVEGGLIYALSAPLRDAIARDGKVVLQLDLAPGRSLERLTADLQHPQGRESLSNHLRRRAGIEGVKAALLRELCGVDLPRDAATLAALIKAAPLTLTAPRPLDEAISSAGGVRFDALDDALMLHDLPGVFCAGEMLDWEAPTGGYLLTACLASGHVAGDGVVRWLRKHEPNMRQT